MFDSTHLKIKMIMDKMSELLITMITASIAGLAWILKRLFKRIDEAHHRIDKLDKLVDRPYLETQLAPIRGEVSLILKTLLETSKRG
jgi:hypothetical protein